MHHIGDERSQRGRPERSVAARRRLHGADLAGQHFHGASDAGADHFGARLAGAYLTGADLSDARLVDADLPQTPGMVEPVFAQTKHNRRIASLQRRGRSAARSEWRLITATHNLLNSTNITWRWPETTRRKRPLRRLRRHHRPDHGHCWPQPASDPAIHESAGPGRIAPTLRDTRTTSESDEPRRRRACFASRKHLQGGSALARSRSSSAAVVCSAPIQTLPSTRERSTSLAKQAATPRPGTRTGDGRMTWSPACRWGVVLRIVLAYGHVPPGNSPLWRLTRAGTVATVAIFDDSRPHVRVKAGVATDVPLTSELLVTRSEPTGRYGAGVCI